MWRVGILIATITNPYEETENDIDHSLWLKFALFLTEFLNLVISYAIVLILLGLTIMTALDIFYLTMPSYQVLLRKRGLDGSNEDSRVKLISRSAIDAANETHITGGNLIMSYLKHRIKTYIISAVMIMIMAMGSPFILGLLDKITEGIRGKFGL